MIQVSHPAPPPPFLTQVHAFISGVLALDPAQAAIRGGLTLLVVLGAALVIWGLHVALKAMGERLAPPAEVARKEYRKRIGRSTLLVARLIVFAGCMLLILRVWGLDLTSVTQGPIGAVLLGAARIALILALALAGIELCDLAITGVFSRIARRASTARRASQLRTLAPVLVGVANAALVVVTAMMALSQVGVEIGPLLAGAGIVGVAVGFGAQTIVKDFLTGIFLILEDTVSVGDIVQIADSGGVVEEMSLRTIKLRDFDGTMHIFPYSEAQVIHNRTRGFSYAVFNLSVSYSANIAKALQVMKDVGETLRSEHEFAPLILAPIEVVGVDQLADSAVILKGRIKTGPAKQWTVGREYLQRIKLAFDTAGIEIPFPHLKLVMPGDPAPADDTQARAAE
jgi:small conductance mechanosensitive channel